MQMMRLYATRRDLQLSWARWLKLAVVFVLSLESQVASSYGQSFSVGPFGSSIRRTATDWSYDGTRILGHIGNDLYVWDAANGNVIHKLVGHREPIIDVEFSPDGNYALSSSWIVGADFPPFPQPDASVRIWDLRTGKQVWRLENQVGGSFSPDGKRLLTHSVHRIGPQVNTFDVDVAMWDISTGRMLFHVKAIDLNEKMIFGPDGRTFVCFQESFGVVLYDASNGRKIVTLDNHESHDDLRRPRIRSFNYYDNSEALATSTPEGFEIWDTRTGKLIRRTPFGVSGFSGSDAAWTSDGDEVISSDYLGDGRQEGAPGHIRVWNVATGKVISMPQCPTMTWARVMGQNGERFLLAGGGYQATGEKPKPLPKIEMWDIPTGKKLWELERKPGLLGFAPDGQTFLVLEGLHDLDGEHPNMHFSVYISDSGSAVANAALLRQ